MSARVYAVLRGAKARQSWRDLVDYTPDELRNHIERQFLQGMGWPNMGEWHIDHIVPLVSFDAPSADSDGFRRAWALTNLRPMWASENCSKGGRVQTLL